MTCSPASCPTNRSFNRPKVSGSAFWRPLIPWLRCRRPIHWPERFGRQAPLVVEIGFGSGEFLCRAARAHPERNFVGIDVRWKNILKALDRLTRSYISNVRLIQADARVVLERLFLPRSIRRIYALFPVPWPHPRSAKHRLFSHAFLKLMNSRLEHHGEVLIVTDLPHHRDWVMEQAAGTGFEAATAEVPPRFETKYERKWRAEGQTRFYEIRLHKRSHVEIPVKEDLPVYCLHSDSFDAEGFFPRGERTPEAIVEFREWLYDPKRRIAMIRAVVVEGPLTQNIWIQVSEDKQRGWRIQPAKGYGLLGTPGVRRALDLVLKAAEQSVSPLPPAPAP